MKRFDALKWIREVRDAEFRETDGLTAKEKMQRTRTAASEFRAGRSGLRRRRTSAGR